MNLPFFIARRYLFSKKKHNAINIISGISVCGVALATLALVCTLSVFNGFQDMVAGFFTAFDPELKITVREGKVFDPLESRVQQVRALPEIDVWTETLEENAMVQYKDRQAMAVIKGVEDNFEQLTSIDSLLYGTGKFILNDSVVDYGFMGVELVSELGTGLQFVDPLRVYAPKRNVRVNIANPSAAFNQDYLFSPGAVFVVNQQKYDSRYILTSLGFARRLFNYDTEVSAIELKLKPGSNTDAVQKKMERILGDRFIVQNRYEQQADVFRIMEIEKLISYLFLTFILPAGIPHADCNSGGAVRQLPPAHHHPVHTSPVTDRCRYRNVAYRIRLRLLPHCRLVGTTGYDYQKRYRADRRNQHSAPRRSSCLHSRDRIHRFAYPSRTNGGHDHHSWYGSVAVRYRFRRHGSHNYLRTDIRHFADAICHSGIIYPVLSYKNQ